jgi:peptidoglycan LD-endopeptidase LytH
MATARPLVILLLALTAGACRSSITPLQPRPGAVTMTPTAPDATDREYFKNNGLMVPVVGVAPNDVRDTFNEARDNGGRIHRATDIMATRGSVIVAASPGKILRLSRSPLGGITIYQLDDNGRFLYYYAHLDHYAEQLSVGQHVAQGDVLGYVGSSGNADPGAPHLHFQAMRWDASRRDYWNGAPVDVRPFFQLIGQEREQ